MEEIKYKIGVAIPCFNNLDVLKNSIPSIYSENFLIALFDDGSDDGTEKWIKKNYPKIHYFKGDSSNWWTGSLSKLINYCLQKECDYILSLNADVVLDSSDVYRLVRSSIKENNAIVASIVVDINKPKEILWSGSKFRKVPYLPLFTSRYIAKAGTSLESFGSEMFQVDEVHGRGVLFPKGIFEIIGNYDSETFPHYGGDTDFSFRAKNNNIDMYVDPLCVAMVFKENTSLNKTEHKTYMEKLYSIKNYLFDRKSGEALRLWWSLYKKHLPKRYLLQSFVFVILLNIYRRL